MVFMVKEEQESMEFELLDTRNDFVFKSIFGVERNKDLLQSFLSAILEIEIKEIVLVDPHLEMTHAEDKASVMDIRVMTKENVMINIEIQLQNHHAFPERMLMYWARMYASQERKNLRYGQLNKAIQIAITDFTFLSKEHFHSMFLLTETENHTLYSDHIEMHVLELPKVNLNNINVGSALEKWLLFIKGDKKVKEALAVNDPTFQKAYKEVGFLSEDQQARWIASSQDKNIRIRMQIEEDARLVREEADLIREEADTIREEADVLKEKAGVLKEKAGMQMEEAKLIRKVAISQMHSMGKSPEEISNIFQLTIDEVNENLA